MRVETTSLLIFRRAPTGLRLRWLVFRGLLDGSGSAINTTTRSDIQLEPGSVSENVTVTTQEPALQTDRADTGRIIEGRQVAELPLGFNRNFQGLLIIVPARPSRNVFTRNSLNSQDSLSSRVNGQSRIFSSVEIEGVE